MSFYVTWQMLTHKYIILLYILQNGNKQHLSIYLNKNRKVCMEESSIKRSKCRTSKSLTWTAVSATSWSVVASSASVGSVFFTGCLPSFLVDFMSCPPCSLVSL